MCNKADNVVLYNGILRVEINPVGAELWSIQTADGHEYLWQGDPKYWEDRAVNLFPTVGRLMDGKYTYEGKIYAMGCHGFAQKSHMEAVVEDNTATFILTDSAETREQYPFAFHYEVRYTLNGNKLEVCFRVYNPEEGTLRFGLGGHPGFYVPMTEGGIFEEYRLRFPKIGKTLRAEFSDKGLLVREYDYEVKDGCLPLEHGLFDNDAIVLRNAGDTVILEHQSGEGRAVEVQYPAMPYIGFWQASFTDAPYICIEPWQSLPGRDGIAEDWASRPGMIELEKGQWYENPWTITIR